MPENNPIVLELKDVHVHYDTMEAVRGVNLVVREKQIVSLLGANGAGKTTILKAISGLKSCAGEIWFKGQRIDNLRPHQIVGLGIGHVPEGRQLFAYMTVLENLELGAHLRKDKVGIAKDLNTVFEFFPVLKTRQKQMAGSLSGGEQQMLAMGRALMSKPALMLLDEPTMGLSPLLCDEISSIIQMINTDHNTSTLLVEQNAMLALGCSQYSYVVEQGKIVLEGESMKLMDDPRVKESYLGI